MSSERNLLHFNLKKFKSHQKEFGFVTKKRFTAQKQQQNCKQIYSSNFDECVYIGDQ